MSVIRIAPEVEAVLADGGPVVALETTLVSHGFPGREGLEVALACEARVRAAGAEPATVGVVDGAVRIGLDEDALTRFADADDARKAGPRDLAACAASGELGATTVGGTLAACCATNVPRDVRPAGASTSPAAPPRREITVRSISSAVCRARSSISRVEGPPKVVVLDSGVCQVCSVGVDSYDQFMGPR